MYLVATCFAKANSAICQCSCCVGQGCKPIAKPPVFIPSCKDGACGVKCTTTFPNDCVVPTSGGQILRNATTLTVILNIPVRVKNIRAGRSQGGLRAQHLTSIQFLAQFSEAKLENANIGTTDIQFTPKTIKSGNFVGDTKTAGSICLMMQTAIPCLLFANGPSELKLLGGTNTEFAPDIDYYKMVFQPIAKRFNFNFDLNIIRRGYYPKGGGNVRISINPIDQLTSIDLTDFGQIKRFFGRSFVAGNLPKNIADEMAEAAKNLIHKNYSTQIPIDIEIVQEPKNKAIGTASGIMIGAETTTGCLLAANALGKRDILASNVGIQATEELLKDLSHEACVDRYLEDQLILLMALAKGNSKIRCGPLSDRTKTAIYVVEHLTNVKFKVTEIPSSKRDDILHLSTSQASTSLLNISNSTTIIECEGLGYQRQL
ncbi:unnamed protein product [Rotaria sp. Silwood2]|nr:unnamed protein product [Rotaria sp. Silwood2]